MNVKTISLFVGKALFVNALFMLSALAVSIYEGYDEGFTPLAISATVTMIVALFPSIFVRNIKSIGHKDGYAIIFLSWLLSFIFGMLPYVLYGGEFTLLNAWFESVSGYTTTGATILTEIESLPKSILFWRSSTHYIGGLGVVVLLLFILPDNTPFKHRLSNLEISAMSKDGYRYKTGRIVRIMLGVYIGMTICETLMLWAAGMSLFDAVNHSFSTIATGGFSTKNNSIMYFDSPLIELIIMLFMTLSSMHFGIIFSTIVTRSLKPFTHSVPKYYLSVIAVLSVAVTASLMLQGGYKSLGNAALDGSFQVISFISTTGFGSADNAMWPVMANILLLFAAFHCGCSGSTTGGIKADRMFVTLQIIRNEFRKRLHPTSVFRVKIDGHYMKDEATSSIMLYIVTYVIILFISFFGVLACGTEVEEAFSAVLSSLGNTGPGIGSLGTMGNFSAEPAVAKIIYSMDMFIGRVEIFPILIIFVSLFRKRK